jgi:L-rhamnose mutarotase
MSERMMITDYPETVAKRFETVAAVMSQTPGLNRRQRREMWFAHSLLLDVARDIRDNSAPVWNQVQRQFTALMIERDQARTQRDNAKEEMRRWKAVVADIIAAVPVDPTSFYERNGIPCCQDCGIPLTKKDGPVLCNDCYGTLATTETEAAR